MRDKMRADPTYNRPKDMDLVRRQQKVNNARPEVKEANRARALKYYAENTNGHRDKVAAVTKAWREAQKADPVLLERLRAVRRVADAKKRATDDQARIKARCKSRLHDALNSVGLKKGGRKTMDVIGCTAAELRAHIESTFQHGMCWANMRQDNPSGRHWQVDHIIPVASFDLSDEEQLRKCHNYTNLRALWSDWNQQKGDKLDWVMPSEEPWAEGPEEAEEAEGPEEAEEAEEAEGAEEAEEAEGAEGAEGEDLLWPQMQKLSVVSDATAFQTATRERNRIRNAAKYARKKAASAAVAVEGAETHSDSGYEAQLGAQ